MLQWWWIIQTNPNYEDVPTSLNASAESFLPLNHAHCLDGEFFHDIGSIGHMWFVVFHVHMMCGFYCVSSSLWACGVCGLWRQSVYLSGVSCHVVDITDIFICLKNKVNTIKVKQSTTQSRSIAHRTRPIALVTGVMMISAGEIWDFHPARYRIAPPKDKTTSSPLTPAAVVALLMSQAILCFAYWGGGCCDV